MEYGNQKKENAVFCGGFVMSLDEMRIDQAVKQKKGLHFILASIILWSAIMFVQMSSMRPDMKNLWTFCCSAPLMPVAFVISKILKIDFTNKGNPLTSLGILFSLNQMIYLLIVMWVYPTVPEKMTMVLAMVFGAHLLPFGWLYKSKSYTVLSVIIPIAALAVGLNNPSYMVAGLMVVFEIIFSVLLQFEVKKMSHAN
jgi:hypothetical protein